ncbi:MAG TPA: hypothetical protein DEP84_03585 [Chloroflexi bacterium]|nr:hypothetical protein [Chloroflexota bacterium]
MLPTIVVVSSHVEAREGLVATLNDQCHGACQSLGLDPSDAGRVAEYKPAAVVLDPLIAPDGVSQLEASLATLASAPPVITITQSNRLQHELYAEAEERLVEELTTVIPALRRLRVALLDAADIIEQERREIVARWIQRMLQIPSFQAQPDMTLQELRDEVPLLIAALVGSLRHGARASAFQPGAEVYAGSVGHARTRIRQGIPLVAVIQEYQFLRRELWLTLRRALTLQRPTATEVFVLGEHFHFTLDSILSLTIEEYRRHNQ